MQESYGPVEHLARTLNGTKQGIRYVVDNYCDKLPKSTKPSHPLQAAVEEYRRSLFESAHYRLELGMYTRSVVLMLEDYIRRTDDRNAACFIKELNKTGSDGHTLHCALDDYLLLGYAYDDVMDNSPLRGDVPAYHLQTSSSLVEDMYWHTRGRLVDSCKAFCPQGGLEIDQLIAAYDGVAEDEGSEHYYYFDLQAEHTPAVAYSNLEKKAKFLSKVVTKPFISAAHVQLPERWGWALQRGYQAAWLTADLYKNAASKDLAFWIELKQGRLPLPVVDALSSSDCAEQQQLIVAIRSIWNHFRPYFADQPMTLDTLARLERADQDPAAQADLNTFSRLVRESGTFSRIDQEIASRRSDVVKTSIDQRGLSHLDFFDAALGCYLNKRKLQIWTKSFNSALAI